MTGFGQDPTVTVSSETPSEIAPGLADQIMVLEEFEQFQSSLPFYVLGTVGTGIALFSRRFRRLGQVVALGGLGTGFVIDVRDKARQTGSAKEARVFLDANPHRHTATLKGKMLTSGLSIATNKSRSDHVHEFVVNGKSMTTTKSELFKTSPHRHSVNGVLTSTFRV